MSTPDKRTEALELAQRCKCAVNQLKQHRRSCDKEHAERVKKIAAAEDAITGWFQRGDLNLPGFEGVSFAPETMQLIHNPLQGL